MQINNDYTLLIYEESTQKGKSLPVEQVSMIVQSLSIHVYTRLHDAQHHYHQILRSFAAAQHQWRGINNNPGNAQIRNCKLHSTVLWHTLSAHKYVSSARKDVLDVKSVAQHSNSTASLLFAIASR